MTSQQIESIKRQMAENPEKFKAMIAEQDAAQQPPKDEEKKEEEEPAVEEEGEEGAEKEATPQKPKQKRPAINKQIAYLEFKDNQGKVIEDGILQSRRDMKDKRSAIKELTTKINAAKKKIDFLKSALDRKEDDRKMEKVNADNFDDEE